MFLMLLDEMRRVSCRALCLFLCCAISPLPSTLVEGLPLRRLLLATSHISSSILPKTTKTMKTMKTTQPQCPVDLRLADE